MNHAFQELLLRDVMRRSVTAVYRNVPHKVLSLKEAQRSKKSHSGMEVLGEGNARKPPRRRWP